MEILKQLLGDIIPNHKRAATDRVSRMEAQPTILINLHEKEDKQFNRQLACQRITKLIKTKICWGGLCPPQQILVLIAQVN